MPKVETYIDAAGDLVICNPEPGTDWERLETLPHDEALAELLEDQTANGYDWIRPEEIAALTDAPIIGWDVKRGDHGEYQDAAAVYWFDGYQVTNAIAELKAGNPVVFKRAD